MNQSQRINQTSNRVEYYTPIEIIEAARKTLKTIDLDVASCEKANQIVGARNYFTKESNGLNQEWYGKVWMNHPFGRGENKKWIDKLVQSYETENIDEAVCITYASTSEKWYQPLLRYPQCYLSSRTNYLGYDLEPIKGVTKGSVVTYLGSNVEQFAECFKHLGSVMIPFNFVPFIPDVVYTMEA